MKPNLLIISNYRDPVAPIRPEAEIVLRLVKEGFQVTVMTPAEGVYPARLKEAGCTLIDHLPSTKFDRATVDLIKHVVSEGRINIVHAFNSKAIANAAWALFWNKEVKLVTYRGYTGNIHWYDPTNYISFLNPRIDYRVCLAESVREMYLKNGISPAKAITINKGHDPAWYVDVKPADLSEFSLPPDAVVCTLVANNRVKMKGIKHVVEAAARLPEESKLHFLLVGTGLNPPSIVSQIRKLGVEERFTFTGYRSDAPALVKASNIALSASLFGEATQKAVIEAMHLGKPVVITDISGNKGMVEHGTSGFVVPPSNPEALKEALLQLDRDPEMRLAMGEVAKRHIKTFLSIERSVEEYTEFYCRIASE